MNLRFLLSGLFIFLPIALEAEPPATNLPPGPVQPAELTNAEPATPAPPQENAKSAPGANAPNGSNGLTQSGQPVTKAPNTPHKRGKNPASAPAAPAPAVASAKTAPPAAAKKAAPSVLENYLSDLGDAVKLTDEEKKDIQTYYLTDGVELKNILNDASLSPLQQAQRVAEVRDRRDDKIGALLLDPSRRREFFRIEAQYRVALTEAAADGALIPAAPAPAAKS